MTRPPVACDICLINQVMTKIDKMYDTMVGGVLFLGAGTLAIFPFMNALQARAPTPSADEQ